MPTDAPPLKPICPAHPASKPDDAIKQAPSGKGTHDTECLTNRDPDLFYQSNAKGYQCKTKRGCEDEVVQAHECKIRPHKKEILCKCLRPDLSLPGACEGPIPLTRDKFIIDSCTGKPNCPSKIIDIGCRVVYPKNGPMTIGYMGHIPGMDVCMQGRNYSTETNCVLRHIKSSERLPPRARCEKNTETYEKAKKNAKWNTKPDCRPLTEQEKLPLWGPNPKPKA